MSGTGGGGAPSGRSPYPSRNPRFSLGQGSEVGGGGGAGGGGAADHSSTTVGGGAGGAHSPFLNNLLRFSPKNSQSHLSPLNRGSVTNAGQQRRARFFDPTSNTAGRGGGQTQQQHQQQQSLNTTTATDADLDADANTANIYTTTVDGIPVDHLRALAQNSLLTAPASAAYYGGLVLAKTGAIRDALLLARAHVQAAQYDACLRILDEANLLHLSSTSSSGGDLEALRWEAVLLACQALHAKKDWNALLEVLEDICRLPDPNQGAGSSGSANSNNDNSNAFHTMTVSQQPINDNDGIGWQSLKRSISAAISSSNTNNNTNASITIHPLALICWYRGLAYHETDSGIRATTYWKLALQLDCQCQAAWEALLDKNLLTPAAAHQLLQDPQAQVEFAPHQEWLRALYLARIELTPQEPVAVSPQEDDVGTGSGGGASNNTSMLANWDASSIQMASPVPNFQTPGGALKNNKSGMTAPPPPNTIVASACGGSAACAGPRQTAPPQIQQDVDTAFDNLWNKFKLQDSPQVLAMAARRAYRRYDWKSALMYCQELSQLDPAVEEVVYCYVATLVLLGHKRVLFRLAHEWVDATPKAAHAWFAVGAYYYCIQRYHVAQRHFCRATRLNPQCTPAWIAFGCSFAACDESDQALASFRAAQRLSPGEHTSLLYMGMEYARTNHLVLAQYFLQAAAKASGGDPLCLHELGVLAAQKEEHSEAIAWFRRALASMISVESSITSSAPSSLQECIDLCHDSYWEPTIFNLGHSYRKTRQFDEAELCFARCVALCPDRFSTYSALAFTEHLKGDLDSAIAHYHEALGIKPDDPFSTDMLNRALTEQTMRRPQYILDPAATAALANSSKKVAAASSTPSSFLLSPVSAFSSRDDSAMSVDSDVDMSGST